MFRIKRRIILMVAATTLLSIVVTACGNETATPEQLPTFTPTSTKTMMPAPTTMVSSTATPYPADPSAWNLEGKEIQIPENEGYTTYALEDWQTNFVLSAVIAVHNRMYGESDGIPTPEEMEAYFDTSSPAWLGGGGEDIGFIGEYEYYVKHNRYNRQKYPMQPGSDAYFTDWRVWGLSPNEGTESHDLQLDEFTVAVSFRMEEQPLYIMDAETHEIIFENTYFGPGKFIYYFQFQEGVWKIVEIVFEDLGDYLPTPTPDH